MSKYLSLLIKPASSACNLRCSYCFYADVAKDREVANYGILPLEDARKMVDRCFDAVEEGGKVAFSFQGGEPTVAGLEWFKNFVAYVNEVKGNKKVDYALQTNGTLIDENWVSFFKENNFLLGISLDGYQSNMDKFRYDVRKKSVYFKLMKNIELLRKAGVDFNILTVVTRSLAKNPKGLFKFYKENHFDFIQLIPCLPSLNQDSIMDKEALTPDMYALFFKGFFDCWYDYVIHGGNMDVNLFSNLIMMLHGQMPYQCGMLGHCITQHVVEGDGSVYPCDFYVLDQFKMGNFYIDSIEDMHNSAAAKYFLDTSLAEKTFCKDCKYVNFCHGGCRRQNICYLKENYCGYQEVLDYILPRLNNFR